MHRRAVCPGPSRKGMVSVPRRCYLNCILKGEWGFPWSVREWGCSRNSPLIALREGEGQPVPSGSCRPYSRSLEQSWAPVTRYCRVGGLHSRHFSQHGSWRSQLKAAITLGFSWLIHGCLFTVSSHGHPSVQACLVCLLVTRTPTILDEAPTLTASF